MFPTENDVFGFSIKFTIWKGLQIHQSAFTDLSIHYYYIVDYRITLPYNPDNHSGQSLRTITPDNHSGQSLYKMLLSLITIYGWGIKFSVYCIISGYYIFLFIYCFQLRIWFLGSLSNSRFGKGFRCTDRLRRTGGPIPCNPLLNIY